MDNLRKQADMGERTCAIPECGKPAASVNAEWCHMHTWRHRKHGDVHWVPVRPTVEQRFWNKVAKGAPDDCWLWIGSKNPRGYGSFYLSGAGANRKSIGAHQYAYILAFGEILDGMWVLHHCDTPSCVNASHLFLGTHEDNMADMRAKGRGPIGDLNGSRARPDRVPRADGHWSHLSPERMARGESAGGAKLTEEKVREARDLVARGATHRAVGERFGVSGSAIQSIIAGKTWRHVT